MTGQSPLSAQQRSEASGETSAPLQALTSPSTETGMRKEQPIPNVDYQPIPEVDYIVDHYAILGVERSATIDEIKSAYRVMMLEWHPDRFANAPDYLKEQANRKIFLAQQAVAILSDDKKRIEYTARLENFDPKLISEDGTPIISLSARRVHIERLMTGAEVDGTKARGFAKQFSGHNDSIFEAIKAAYSSNKHDAGMRAAYHAVLEKKLAFYDLLEKLEWHYAGVSNQTEPKNFAEPQDYIEKRKAQIQATGSEIENLVERKLLQLSSGEAMLLLTTGGKFIGADDLKSDYEKIREDLSRIAKSHFEKYSGSLLELAQKRVEIIAELLTHFSNYRYLVDLRKDTRDLLVLLNCNGALGVALQFTCSENGASMASVNLPDIKKPADLEDPLLFGRLLASYPNCSIVHLTINPNIDLAVQACHVMQQHISRGE